MTELVTVRLPGRLPHAGASARACTTSRPGKLHDNRHRNERSLRLTAVYADLFYTFFLSQSR